MSLMIDFSIENGGSFHSYVGLPEGTIKKRSGRHFSLRGANLELPNELEMDRRAVFGERSVRFGVVRSVADR